MKKIINIIQKVSPEVYISVVIMVLFLGMVVLLCWYQNVGDKLKTEAVQLGHAELVWPNEFKRNSTPKFVWITNKITLDN